METIDSNKLIAEFMELESKPLAKGLFQLQFKHSYSNHGFLEWINQEMLKYHSSWNWLAPVLEKICRMQIGDGITYVEYAYPRTFGMLSEEDGQIMVRLNGFQLQKADTLIEATYLAIMNFIEYYNEFLKDNVSNNQS